MKLYFRRQIVKETKGLINRQEETKFLLHLRMELTSPEVEIVNKFQLGRKELYSWLPSDIKMKTEEIPQFTQSITVAKVATGCDLRFTDYVELLDAEEIVTQNAERLADLLKQGQKFEPEEVREF
jgi:hypothetical protein